MLLEDAGFFPHPLWPSSKDSRPFFTVFSQWAVKLNSFSFFPDSASSSRNLTPSQQCFRSHIPRPEALGRSESSGSSSKSVKRSPSNNSNVEAGNNRVDSVTSEEDEEDLLASCITFGLPKSKSEPLDLKNKFGAKGKKSSKADKSVRRRENRSKSKSPRNSKLIPGVRISELRLVPKEKQSSSSSESTPQKPSQDTDVTPTTLPFLKPPSMALSDIWNDESPNCIREPPQMQDSMSVTLTQSSVNHLQHPSVSVNDSAPPLTASGVLEFEAARVSHQVREAGGLASSVCSTLSSIQPPSMMDSLISMGDKREGEGSPSHGPASMDQKSTSSVNTSSSSFVTTKMECRHTLSAKKGHQVPEMVRRALGVGNGGANGSNEDLTSMSSCHSNLDNIQPPTIMADMDNSFLSIASLSSEVADVESKMARSDETRLESLNMELVKPSAEEAAKIASNMAAESYESPSMARKFDKLQEQSVAECTALDDIAPPTCMDDVSGVITERTLVPEHNGEQGATYVIDGEGEGGLSTCADITEICDDEVTIERTLTLGSDAEEAPDLPKDQSGSESSREATPRTKKKLVSGPDMNYYKKYRVPVPNIDDSSDCVGQDTSGYKSGTTTPSGASTVTSRQRRKDDADRFRTHTITKEDLTGSSRENSPLLMKKTSMARLIKADDSESESSTNGSPKKSPKTLKQRREEEAERFRTRTITAEDLKKKANGLSPVDVKMLEEGADMVRRSIETNKASARSRSTSVDVLNRSRSASAEILDEKEMTLTMDIGGSDPSLAATGSPRRARICKPGEESPSRQPEAEPEVRGIRGRRKALYSTPPKRSTVPPAVAPKPTISAKPRNISSAPSPSKVGSPPTQIRGTRATALKQNNSHMRVNAPPSPKTSPRSTASGYISSSSSTASSRSSTSRLPYRRTNSATQGRPTQQPPMIRQGTFTKDDSSPNPSGDEARGASMSKMPPRGPPRPSLRKDVVHPANRAPVASGRAGSTSQLPDRSRRPSADSRPRPQIQKIGQTKTSQLRERSASRNGRLARESNLQKNAATSSSNSSLASMRSAKSASAAHIRTSTSNQNFRTVSSAGPGNLGRRIPSSSSIDPRNATTDTSNLTVTSIDTQSERGSSSISKKSSKKEVTSKIANLWKRVEDSKKKNKEKDKDPRVWITQGKVIPENELALLKVHSEQQEIISNFQAQAALAKTELSNQDVKPRSKSRLSLKLSKFAKGKKDKDGKTPTTPTADESEVKNEDTVNGNSATLESVFSEDNEECAELAELADCDEKTKRHSRLGTFFNPETNATTSTPTTSSASIAAAPTDAANVIKFRSINRSPVRSCPPSSVSGPCCSRKSRFDGLVQTTGWSTF